MDLQRSRHFAKETQAIPLIMKLTNILAPDHLDRLLWHAEFFQVPTKERWKTFRARHIIHFSKESSKLKLYSGLSFDCQTNFRLGAFALWFHFQWKAFVKCYCLCEPIKSFFVCVMPVTWPLIDLSYTCFWFPKTESDIINILLALLSGSML